MTMIPPAPGAKIATTRSLLWAVVIAMILALGFYLMVRQVFSDANRRVSEEEKEQFWRNMEETQAKIRLAERTNAARFASGSDGAEKKTMVILASYVGKTYQEMVQELGAPSDKTGYTIERAPTKNWNHGELFSKFPKTVANKNVQIMEVVWGSGDCNIFACFHLVEGENRCLVAKRIHKSVRF